MHAHELDDRALEALVLVGRRAAGPVLARHGGELADGHGRLGQQREEARAGDGLLGSFLLFATRHGRENRTSLPQCRRKNMLFCYSELIRIF